MNHKATASISSFHSNDEFHGSPLLSAAAAAVSGNSNDYPSQSESFSGNRTSEQLQESSHYGNKDGDNHLIQRRISKIYKRLKETDANLKTMDTLLGWRNQHNAQQRNFKKQSYDKRRSISSNSSPNRSEHGKANYRDHAKSIENLQVSGVSKSPTLEQLQRLTQSMQDLHNYQQRCHEDLKTEVQSINRNDPHDIQNLTDFIKQHREDSCLSKEILINLTALQNEVKASQTNMHINSQIIALIDNLRKDIQEFRHNKAASSLSASNEDALVRRLSDIGSQQCNLEHMIEILAQQLERFHSRVPQKCENHEAHMQTQMEETLKTSLETSKQVERLTAKVQRMRHVRHISSTDSDKDATKHKKYPIQKLKSRCEGLLNEKKHLEELCRIVEEKCHMMLQEKEILMMQLNDVQNKLRDTVKELQETKDKLVEGQIHGIRKESLLQQCKIMHEETQKNLVKHQDKVEKLKHSNERLAQENSSLHHQIEYFKKEMEEYKERRQMTTSFNNTSNISNEVLKESLKLLEAQSDKVKCELERQLQNEKESNKKLSDAISELKNVTAKETEDILKQKEAEYEPIITLLKQQISEYKVEVANLYQENKNLANEKSQVSKELLKVQSEIRDLHKKQERLLKNFYVKDEELQLKLHQYEDLETNMADLRRVSRKMEQDYKAMLSTINAEVDRTLQLWNKTSMYTLKVPATSEINPVHPKVQFVDINSKLKWMQDEMCARPQPSNKLSRVSIHQDVHYTAKGNQNENASATQMHHIQPPKTDEQTNVRNVRYDATNLNILTDCTDTNNRQKQGVILREPKIYTSTKLNVHPSSEHNDDPKTNFKNTYKNKCKRMNSTEINTSKNHVNKKSSTKEILEGDSFTTDSTPQLSSISTASNTDDH